eukprot:jgi/Mesvir1/12325/Mv00515-RA.1
MKSRRRRRHRQSPSFEDGAHRADMDLAMEDVEKGGNSPEAPALHNPLQRQKREYREMRLKIRHLREQRLKISKKGSVEEKARRKALTKTIKAIVEKQKEEHEKELQQYLKAREAEEVPDIEAPDGEHAPVSQSQFVSDSGHEGDVEDLETDTSVRL